MADSAVTMRASGRMLFTLLAGLATAGAVGGEEPAPITALKPMLDELGLRLRMFNRKDQIAVIGVLSTQIDAVPATIEAVQPYSELFRAVGPDVIEFK